MKRFNTTYLIIALGVLIIGALIGFNIYCWFTYSQLPWEEIPWWCKWLFIWE